MSERRRANVIGVLRIVRERFSRRSIDSVSGVNFDRTASSNRSASFVDDPPR